MRSTATTPGSFRLLASLLFILLTAASVSTARASYLGNYNVPRQTPVQAEAFQQVSEIAKEASEAATPVLLAYLDSTEFRQSISNLPDEITSMNSEDLLVLLNETIVLSIMTHGIYASAWGDFDPATLDVTLDQLIQYNLTFIPNLWQRVALGLLNTSSAYQQLAMLVENTAETHLMLLPEFNTTEFDNVTLEEASTRVSYTAIDIYRVSASAQYYGNVQMVMNPAYAKPMMLVSPYDTGGFAACCLVNASLLPANTCFAMNFTGDHKCPNLTMGTLYSLNHLYLQNMYYWRVPAITNLLQRFFAKPQPAATLAQEVIYFEGDMLGNILIPDAIQYVIGDFSTLFGKTQGFKLQSWCIEYGLPLVWTIAIPNVYFNSFYSPYLSAPQNTSFLDPVVLPTSSIVNISSSDQSTTTELFSLAWKLIDTTLAANASMQNSTDFWMDSFQDLFSSIPLTMHLNQLRPNECDDDEHCFGTDDMNNCLCRYPPPTSTP
eukprot:TRINITY_DN12450_c0_g1_i1.p1 TRINITY_DN12450_c0_g1~~TRINITY_DN12450_c0_g1_i1.p1  ORF type:complete len:502 (+),score=75.99 TRINITY_DN12450_c0_g1_i1:32-1507(+)